MNPILPQFSLSKISFSLSAFPIWKVLDAIMVSRDTLLLFLVSPRQLLRAFLFRHCVTTIHFSYSLNIDLRLCNKKKKKKEAGKRGFFWVILCFGTIFSSIKNHIILWLGRTKLKSRKMTVQEDPQLPFLILILVIQTCQNSFFLTWDLMIGTISIWPKLFGKQGLSKPCKNMVKFCSIWTFPHLSIHSYTTLP